MSGEDTFDIDDRLASPNKDHTRLNQIELEFAIPVYVTYEQIHMLQEFMDSVVHAPENTPREGVHWTSSMGNKPHFSAVDAALLGKALDSDGPANGEEPVFDDDVLVIGTSARGWVSETEREQVLRRRSTGKEAADGSFQMKTRFRWSRTRALVLMRLDDIHRFFCLGLHQNMSRYRFPVNLR